MHQQIRVVLATPSSVQDGSGAMAVVPVEVDPREIQDGALFRLLDLLAGEKFNLRFAGGSRIEAGGELVFGIDDEGDEGKASKCAAFLARNGYADVRVVEPFMCEVADEVGALRDCLAKLSTEGRRIDEVFVGTPRKGKVPIHITTIRSVSSGGGAQKGEIRRS
jgi:hypothetical protein